MLFFRNKVCWRNLKPLPATVGEKRIMLRMKRGKKKRVELWTGRQALVSDGRCFIADAALGCFPKEDG